MGQIIEPSFEFKERAAWKKNILEPNLLLV